jgi:hypothetical protein
MIIDELAWFPSGMKPVALGKDSYYTSDELKSGFVEAISKGSLEKHPKAVRGIKILIDREIIVPAHVSKTKLGYLWARWWKTPESYKMGSTHVEGKIFIFLDNRFAEYGVYDSNIITGTLIHELAHYIAHINIDSYIEIYKSILIKYYRSFCSMYFNITKKIDDKLIFEYVTILKDIEKNMINRKYLQHGDTFKRYYALMEKIAAQGNLSEEAQKKAVNNLFGMLHIYFRSRDGFMAIRNRSFILRCLLNAYSLAFKINPNTICIQELYMVSETLAILSEIKHKYIIKYLEGIK